MSNKAKLIIGAGGTGGHMFPASAFAAEMRSREWEVGLITDKRGMRYGDDFPCDWRYLIQAESLNLKHPLSLITGPIKISLGVLVTLFCIIKARPDLVIGFGGYPAFPVLLAARLCAIPIIIHEQNTVLGRVNRVFASSARAIISGFAYLEKLPAPTKKYHHTLGNPVRTEIAKLRMNAYKMPCDGQKLNILVIGGSQGANLFSKIIPYSVAKLDETLRKNLNITQQVHPEQIHGIETIYQQSGISATIQPFFKDIAEHLRKADLVITRAGASSITELTIAGRASILIPLGIAMDDHQRHNANMLYKAGAADIILEQDFSIDSLTKALKLILPNHEGLYQMAKSAHKLGRPCATTKIADLAESIGKNR